MDCKSTYFPSAFGNNVFGQVFWAGISAARYPSKTGKASVSAYPKGGWGRALRSSSRASKTVSKSETLYGGSNFVSILQNSKGGRADQPWYHILVFKGKVQKRSKSHPKMMPK